VTTLITGPSAERRATRAGFTLLELVLVMVVIGTVLGMAAPSLRGFFESRKAADAASTLVALTQFARSGAIAEGRIYRLSLDEAAGTYRLSAQEGGAFVALNSEFGRVFRFPEGVRSEMLVQGADESRDYVDFYPDGRTEPTVIVLRGMQGEMVEIRCLSPAEAFRIVPGSEREDG